MSLYYAATYGNLKIIRHMLKYYNCNIKNVIFEMKYNYYNKDVTAFYESVKYHCIKNIVLVLF